VTADEYGRTYPLPGPFRSLDHIRGEHRQRGGHYFDADTSRFFRARYVEDVYAGAIFVDSVRGPGMPREYRVKIIGEGTSISTLRDPDTGRPCEYSTLREARAAARRVCDAASVAPESVEGIPSAAAWWPDAQTAEGVR